MPKKQAKLKTAIGVVVDESGSMHVRAEETRIAFNKYFDNVEKDDPTAVVTVANFSDRGTLADKVRYLCKDTKVTDIPYLDEQNYSPNGNTPLLDAVGEVVTELDKTTADRYLVVILTDGYENASREWTTASIKEYIRTKEATDKWTFVFLGAGVDAWAGAQGLGISTPGTTFSYSGESGTTMDSVAVASAGTRSYLGSTKTSDPDFMNKKKNKS